MIKAGKFGVWMNHSIAHLIEFTSGFITVVSADLEVNDESSFKSLATNETRLLLQEQALQSAYYRKLSEALCNCKELILFGPTPAKVKLYTFLRTDLRFKRIKIRIIQTDNMTEIERQIFVKDHFTNR